MIEWSWGNGDLDGALGVGVVFEEREHGNLGTILEGWEGGIEMILEKTESGPPLFFSGSEMERKDNSNRQKSI